MEAVSLDEWRVGLRDLLQDTQDILVSMLDESSWSEPLRELRDELDSWELDGDAADFDVLAAVQDHLATATKQWTIVLGAMFERAEFAAVNLESYWAERSAR